jgi:protein-tyrosine phosphatase
MAASKDAVLDASNITRRLWVGGKPPFDRDLPDFDVLVLCAEELQPAQLAFHGHVVRVSIPDATLDQGEINRVINGARIVGRSLLEGQRVLVTCAAGINRSALVAALGLGMVTRMKPNELVALMRQKRSAFALSNPHFVHVLHRFVIDKPRGERGIKR